MFDINSHKTNAGNGSNRKEVGARVFHPSQVIVQIKIRKKKFMLPTWSVIHNASLSRADRLLLC